MQEGANALGWLSRIPPGLLQETGFRPFLLVVKPLVHTPPIVLALPCYFHFL